MRYIAGLQLDGRESAISEIGGPEIPSFLKLESDYNLATDIKINVALDLSTKSVSGMVSMLCLHRALPVLVLALMAYGCVSFAPELNPQAIVAQDKSYLYGRFFLDDKINGLLGSPKIGVQITNKETTENFVINLAKSGTYQVIEVPPGGYSITKIFFTLGGNETAGAKSLPDSMLTKPFRAEAGKAYYIADIEGTVTRSGTYISWQITSIRDNFVETTHYMLKKYPNFSGVETIRAIEQTQ